MTVTSGTDYKDATALNGQKYYYKVCAVSNAGEGPATGILSATPHAPNGPGFSDDSYNLLLISVVIVIFAGMAVSFLRRRK